MQDFANKTAFVTGGGSGIGRGIGRSFAKARATVVIGCHCRTSKDHAVAGTNKQL